MIYSIYKPNNNNTGGATQINYKFLNPKKNYEQKYLFFWSSAKQKSEPNENGNAVFDWDNSINFKLEPVDICKLLAVLKNKEDKVSLFHQHPDGNRNTNLLLEKYNNPKYQNSYKFRLSYQNKEKNETGFVQHLFTSNEAIELEIFLSELVKLYYF